jgi:hypothetical protein
VEDIKPGEWLQAAMTGLALSVGAAAVYWQVHRQHAEQTARALAKARLVAMEVWPVLTTTIAAFHGVPRLIEVVSGLSIDKPATVPTLTSVYLGITDSLRKAPKELPAEMLEALVPLPASCAHQIALAYSELRELDYLVGLLRPEARWSNLDANIMSLHLGLWSVTRKRAAIPS